VTHTLTHTHTLHIHSHTHTHTIHIHTHTHTHTLHIHTHTLLSLLQAALRTDRVRAQGSGLILCTVLDCFCHALLTVTIFHPLISSQLIRMRAMTLYHITPCHIIPLHPSLPCSIMVCSTSLFSSRRCDQHHMISRANIQTILSIH
jgi:hypothetical protein